MLTLPCEVVKCAISNVEPGAGWPSAIVDCTTEGQCLQSFTSGHLMLLKHSCSTSRNLPPCWNLELPLSCWNAQMPPTSTAGLDQQVHQITKECVLADHHHFWCGTTFQNVCQKLKIDIRNLSPSTEVDIQVICGCCVEPMSFKITWTQSWTQAPETWADFPTWGYFSMSNKRENM